ncbi:MAG: PEP-CTERM sorting domain-containing protein [Spirulinaceae cyanobacterium]
MPSLLFNLMRTERVQSLAVGLFGSTVALTSWVTPAAAAPVTVDFDGTVEAFITSDDDFAAFVEDLGFALPNGDVDDVIAGSITVDDDPSQYLDGDLSLGYDLLSSTLGMEVDAGSIALLDSFFDFEVSGSGQVTDGTTTMDYSLRFDASANEFKAIFDNFDPDNEILSACATGECDWSGLFSFSVGGVNIFDPNAGLVPTKLIESRVSFNLKTNARSGGNVGDFEIATSNEDIQQQIDEVLALKEVTVAETPATEVPEPSMIIGLGMLLGLGALLKDRKS